MSHTKTAGSQLASYPTERLTHSLAGPRADVSQQVASSEARNRAGSARLTAGLLSRSLSVESYASPSGCFDYRPVEDSPPGWVDTDRMIRAARTGRSAKTGGRRAV
jgi:hypothetical protein